METTSHQVEKARESDLTALKILLSSVNLPTSDLPSPLNNFLVIKEEKKVMGSIGIEVLGKYALLRSLAVDLNHRSLGLGQKLYKSAIKLAKNAGIEEIFLITNTADQYFEKRGFAEIERESAPQEIKNTAQFTGVCPSTATVMRLII
ncbi:MAG TPA: arsenic resistance N-acetyltransferase ArsN2 [Cytophagales bacterium]|nr:arsenic resistance N-acetyltransferase ArsN2 [Cytophagales bacterium]